MGDISHQLVESVQSARADGRTLNIQGRGSKTFMGREAQGDVLSLADHTGIVEYHPVELVLTVRAGTPVSEIQQVLAEQGQYLSCESPEFDGKASIGGTLACNLSGPSRPWSGSIRDLVLGTRIINGKGEHLRFGGQVMKNVAGYDVSRLQAGAMGTLGVITEISFKVMPKPASTMTLVRDMDAAEAIATMNELAGQPKPLNAATWVDGRLYLRLSGAKSAVEGTAEKWQGSVLEGADQFWSDLRDQKLEFFAGDKPLWRFSVNSSKPMSAIDNEGLIDWGGAQRWLRGEREKTQMEKLAEAAGGQVSLFRGGDRSSEVMHTHPKALQHIHQQVKAAMDPDGIFNPGRLYGWL